MSKLRRFLIIALGFIAALAGNLIAGWIQQDVWANLFTPVRIIGASVGVGLVILIVVLLESDQSNKPRSSLISKALKPKPRLSITVRDITCYVKGEIHETDRWTGPRLAWWVECMVEITNKRRAKATRVLGSMNLSLRSGDSLLTRESKRTHKTYILTKPEVRRESIVFEPEYFDPFVNRTPIEFYPDASYRLDYTYSCQERSRPQRATTTGRLTKVDWVGEEEDLSVVRKAGFRAPR